MYGDEPEQGCRKVRLFFVRLPVSGSALFEEDAVPHPAFGVNFFVHRSSQHKVCLVPVLSHEELLRFAVLRLHLGYGPGFRDLRLPRLVRSDDPVYCAGAPVRDEHEDLRFQDHHALDLKGSEVKHGVADGD